MPEESSFEDCGVSLNLTRTRKCDFDVNEIYEGEGKKVLPQFLHYLIFQLINIIIAGSRNENKLSAF